VGILTEGDDGKPVHQLALIPVRDLEIKDDWYVTGLRGSGSNSVVASDLFVPAANVGLAADFFAGRYTSAAAPDEPSFRGLSLAYIGGISAAIPVGMADGTIEAFLETSVRKPLSATHYKSKAEAPVVHLRVAEALMRADAARLVGHEVTSLVDALDATDTEASIEERARVRALVSYALETSAEAVAAIARINGGSTAVETNPIQRFLRDIATASTHAFMNPENSLELYGRVRCGQPPLTDLL
jgi:alkylation response protein AidB-like acyl-CoA dehydrogenase